MTSTIVSSDNFTPASWSGGTTIELYIFPRSADYQQRNFKFRISTATVELEKSEYTPLVGVSRTLMVLHGKTALTHHGHHTKMLDKFDIDEFEGDWKTSSIGMSTNFNLMTIGETKGELKPIILEINQTVDYQLKEEWNWLFLFAFSGKIRVNLDSQSHILNKGDLMVISKPTIPILSIKAIEHSELILTCIAK